MALFAPPLFTWFSGPWITYGLGGIMLGMGLTLRWADFSQVLTAPLWIFTGMLLQFSVMPLLGWGLGLLFNLPPFFAVGLILVACCPGGTASNVIVYLAKANVALSVAMTTCSTL
ncbi:MAG: bile acid:sodium symporter, partial [Flavobacteriaceae bacterium]